MFLFEVIHEYHTQASLVKQKKHTKSGKEIEHQGHKIDKAKFKADIVIQENLA